MTAPTHAVRPWWAQWLSGHAKAILGGLVAAAAALGTALADGHLTGEEIPGVFAAFLVGLGAVHLVPNTGPLANATEVPLATVTDVVGNF